MTDTASASQINAPGAAAVPPPGDASGGTWAPNKTPRARAKRIGGSIGKHTLLIGAATLMIYPLLWMLVSSLRPTEIIFRTPGLWLQNLEFENYVAGWQALTHPFGHYLLNSSIVVIGCILGNLVSCSMAAYAFARLEFPLRRLLFGIMLITIMIPFHVIVIPQYILFSQLDWINTFWPLVVPKILATDAFFIFLMVQFIRGIPKDMDEAARIDGAGHARIFIQVILPLMIPALATTTIFTFIWTWNDFFTALIYLTSPDMFTVPVALRSYVDATGQSNWGALFAMSIVSLLPVFFAFLLGQKFLVKGIATTGIK
ncbi:carbohydrate ABC transporter permease [Ornithinicoccus halotolerans]|uniref:carbohydrate ABC transporter permease n=1 Tax=Ornithinicoccus halotolerans TaxID=1748220 RepID=UPI001294D780|nr:carbohydrate ABC transporter permease [Ornithinicoccus halotolerans]